MSRFHPRDLTRKVMASQFGQRSPAGRMKKNTVVAAIRRRMKNPTKMTAKMTASDIASLLPLEPLLHLKPRLNVGQIAFDSLDHYLGAFIHGDIVEAAG